MVIVWTLFGLLWVILHGVSDLFSSWQGSFGGHQSIDLWRAVPHCPIVYLARTKLKMFRKEGTVYFRI